MFKNNKLYKVIDGFRIYDIYNVNEIDLMCSELSIFCNNWIQSGGNLFFVETSPNNTISLNEKELEYIYLLDQNCKNFDYLDQNNNINYLMENQKKDLLLLDLDNINFLFIIPKFNENNNYYFHLFISFKKESMCKNLLNLNFKIINIKNINKIENLSFFDIKNIFNFDNNKFLQNKFDYRFLDILNINHEKKKIIIQPLTENELLKNFNNFLAESSKSGEIDKNWKLEIKNLLNNFLEKPDINFNLKKISYFFYWNIEILNEWDQFNKLNYTFMLDDGTNYSLFYGLRINSLCVDFRLNTFTNNIF